MEGRHLEKYDKIGKNARFLLDFNQLWMYVKYVVQAEQLMITTSSMGVGSKS